MNDYVRTGEYRSCDGCGSKTRYEFISQFLRVQVCRSCAVELADQIREEIGDDIDG